MGGEGKGREDREGRKGRAGEGRGARPVCMPPHFDNPGYGPVRGGKGRGRKGREGKGREGKGREGGKGGEREGRGKAT